MAATVLIEATPLLPGGTTTVAVRLAGGGSRAYTHKGFADWIAGVANLPRFTTALGFDETGWTGGAIPQTSNIRFSAADRASLTTIAGYYWRGARFVISIGDDSFPAPTWTVVLTGSVADMKTDGSAIIFTVADLTGDLAKTVLPDTFAGTGGIEGGTDATGRVKRRTWGRVFNVEGFLLDKANNIYEFGDPARPLQGFPRVKDKGLDASSLATVAWAGSIAATFAALQAATPPSGGATIAPSIACVKWWTQPAGPIAADILGTAASYSEATADIITALLATYAPAITFGNYAATASARPAVVGLHCSDPSEDVANLFDRLLLPQSSLWALDPSGALYVRQWTFVGPVETVQADSITRDTIYPPLVTRKLGYQRNHRVQTDGEISAVLSDASATVSPYLSNPAVVVASASDGTGAVFTAAGGNMVLVQGDGGPITTGVTYATVAGTSSGGITASINSSTGAYVISGLTGDQGAITFRATYLGVNYDLIYSIAKSKAGISAPVLGLQNTADAITVDGTGAASPASQSIAFTAQLGGVSGTASFSATAYNVSNASLGAVTLSGSGNSRTLSNAQFLAPGATVSYVVVTATLGSLSDTVTIVKLTQGSNGITPSLSNENVTLGADYSGNVTSGYTAASGTYNLYLGANRLASGVFYQIVSAPGVTISINSSTGAYTVSALSADLANVTIRATYNGVDYDKIYTIGKSRSGSPGVGTPGANGVGTTQFFTVNVPSFDGVTITDNVSAGGSWTSHGAYGTPISGGVSFSWVAPNPFGNPTDFMCGIRAAPGASFNYTNADFYCIRFAAQATGIGSATSYHTEIWMGGTNVASDLGWSASYTWNIRYDAGSGAIVFSYINAGVSSVLYAGNVGANRPFGPQMIFAQRGQVGYPAFGAAGKDGTTSAGKSISIATSASDPINWPYPVSLENGQSATVNYSLACAAISGNATITTYVEYALAGSGAWNVVPGSTDVEGYAVGDPVYQGSGGSWTNTSGVKRAYDVRWRYSKPGAGVPGTLDRSRSTFSVG